MLGVTTPQMVAAVSNNGGLGSLPVGGLSPEATRELIRKTRSLTAGPYAVNLFAHETPDRVEEKALEQMQEFLERYAREKTLPEFMLAVESAGIEIPEYTFQNSLTAGIRAHGQKNNLPDQVSLWSGQSGNRARRASSAVILAGLVKDLP